MTYYYVTLSKHYGEKGEFYPGQTQHQICSEYKHRTSIHRTIWKKKTLTKFGYHPKQVLIATMLIKCYSPEQYSVYEAAVEA